MHQALPNKFSLPFLAAILLLLTFACLTLGAQTALGADGFIFTEDTVKGYLTAENSTLKVVWHDRPLSSEYNNRGGGNIYELYDKRTDPQMAKNLVTLLNSNATTPAYPGIGGLGATYVYELGSGVAKADNSHGRVVSQTHSTDPEGNAVFESSHIVKSTVQSGADNYQVDKKWIVYPNGQIKLSLKITFLRSFDASEPAYNFSFSHNYGWTKASSLGHNWSPISCLLLGIGNLSNTLSNFDNINSLANRNYSLQHSQSFHLYGQGSGVSIKVKMDNGGKGYEHDGGLFNLGKTLWGTTANPTSEYTNWTSPSHTLHYYGWWGTGSPPPERHKLINAGTVIADTLWIEMLPTSSMSAPEISNLEANPITESLATLNWSTNVATDARVSYWPAQETSSTTVTDAQWSPNHKTALVNLTPGTTYQYEVRSSDGLGEAIQSGSFTTTSSNQNGDFQLGLTGVSSQWASYSDYKYRLLTTTFSIKNFGTAIAYDTQALSVTASPGVIGTIQNSQLGNINPGETKTLAVVYFLQNRYPSFRTTIKMISHDGTGNPYEFTLAQRSPQ